MSQSLNLFVESPNIGKLSSMYMYAWKQGVKTTYYLRTMGATHAEKSTISAGSLNAVPMGGGQGGLSAMEAAAAQAKITAINQLLATAQKSEACGTPAL